MEKILIAVDGSEHSLRALAEAKKLAGAFNSEIVLVCAVEPAMPSHLADVAYVDKIERFQMDAGNEIVTKAVEELGEFKGNVDKVVTIGDPADIIVNSANQKNADLIVMGSRGLSGIKRLMIGSVSHKVLNISNVSVLIIK